MIQAANEADYRDIRADREAEALLKRLFAGCLPLGHGVLVVIGSNVLVDLGAPVIVVDAVDDPIQDVLTALGDLRNKAASAHARRLNTWKRCKRVVDRRDAASLPPITLTLWEKP